MANKSFTALLALAAALTIAAGCGGSDEGDSGSSSGPTARTPEMGAALQECFGEIRSNTANGDAPLSKADRAELRAQCKDAVDGGVPELKETTKRVCAQVVEKSVPRGVRAYDLSLGQCRNGTRRFF